MAIGSKVNVIPSYKNNPGELWMSNEEGTYSYYGTRGEDMTSGRSSEAFVQPKSVICGVKGHKFTRNCHERQFMARFKIQKLHC